MKPGRKTQSGKISRLAVVAIVFGSILLNVVLLVYFCEKAGRTGSTAGAQAAGVGQAQAPSAAQPQAPLPEGAAPPGPATAGSAGSAGPDSATGEAPRARIPDWRKEAASWPSRADGAQGAGARRESAESNRAYESGSSAGGAPFDARAAAPTGKSAGAGRSSAPAGPVVAPVISGAAYPVAVQHAPGSTQGATTVDPTVAVPDDPTSDRRPPVLQSLRFDPPNITDGGVTTLLVYATDDLSGVQRVSGNLTSPSGAAIIPFRAEGDPAGGVFAARLTIPSKAETGVWFVGNLYILDKADNPLAVSFTQTTVPPGGALQVSSAESDSTPPTVHDVRLDRATVNGGERNHVRIEVDDDRSGVASVTGAFQSPSRTATLPFVCHAGADAGFWEGDIPIPRDADCGTWTLQHLRVADTAGNIAFLWSDNPVVSRAGFGVTSDSCDSVAPTLDAFSIAPTTVSNTAQVEIQVTATVTDVGSGALSMTGVVTGPVATNGQTPTLFFSCARASNEPTGLWSGKIIVPQLAAKGLWRVTLVRLQDRAYNIREYKNTDPAIAQGAFEVQ